MKFLMIVGGLVIILLIVFGIIWVVNNIGFISEERGDNENP